MQSIHFIVLLLQTFNFSALAQNTTDSVDNISIPTISTQSINTTLPLATPGALAPESECSGNSSLNNFCPACGASMIPFGDFGGYAVTCDSVYANVRYYADIHYANVFQCIQACQDFHECHAPVISPDGRCLLAVVESGVVPVIASGMGYAALEPKSFGGSTSSANSTSTSSTPHLEGGVPPRTTHRSTATTKHAPTCQASAITCPRCNGAHITEPLGKTHEVLCDRQLWSEKYYSIQEWLTPEGCMAECDKYSWCKGSNFWPEGNCELARGQDAILRSQAGYTAFIPAPSRHPTPLRSAYPTTYPTFSTPLPSSTLSTVVTSSAYRTARPIFAKCNHEHISCPACNGVEFTDGLNQKYCVHCDLQPICAYQQGTVEHTTAKGCMQQCDRAPDCQAAIFEHGHCALCRGMIESFTPWVLPHDYAVFIADEVMKSLSTAAPSSTPTNIA